MCLCGRQLSQLLQIFYFLVIAIIIIKILMFRLHASLFRMRVTMLQFRSARLLRIEFFFVFWTCYFRSVQPWIATFGNQRNIILFNQHTPLPHSYVSFIQNMLGFPQQTIFLIYIFGTWTFLAFFSTPISQINDDWYYCPYICSNTISNVSMSNVWKGTWIIWYVKRSFQGLIRFNR